MARKRFTVEQIINHLREADVLLAQDLTVGEVCRRIGVSEQSYYRWRKEYGGLKVNQARRLKDLELCSGRLQMNTFWTCGRLDGRAAQSPEPRINGTRYAH